MDRQVSEDDRGLRIATWTSTPSPSIDRLLLVLMLVSMRSGGLTCEPFLIVGLIASIRRALVITLQPSRSAGTEPPWSPGKENVFRTTMIELGVLAVLILVMVISIYMLQRGGSPSSDDRARNRARNR